MRPLFRAVPLLMLLMVRPALALECYETYSPACREKFTADNLPVPHKPDKKIKRDADLLVQIENHILDGQALDKRAEALRQAIQIDEAPRSDAESEEDKTLRLEKILAQRKRLREIETEKYAAFNAAIGKTIELYHLRPKVTDPINHTQMFAEGMRPWAPRYSENETYEKDPATGILMGRRLSDEENRKIWKQRGVNFSSNAPVPPANGAGTSREDARIALFPGAFASPDHLASLIFHETTHWLDRNARGRAANPSEHFESEIRAYQKQIGVQKIFNLQPADVKLLEKIKGVYAVQLRDNDSISWKEMEHKHPEWLHGSNLPNSPQLQALKPEPLKAGGELSFLDGLATGEIQEAAEELRQRQDERHRELQKWAKEREEFERRQKDREQMMAEIAKLQADLERRYPPWRRSQLYVQGLAGEACADPLRLSGLAEEGKVIRVDLSRSASSYEAGDRLSDCQREILDQFDTVRGGGAGVTSHDFIRWAHSYRKSHPSLVRKLANAFTGFFEVFGSLFDGGGASDGTRESSGGGGRSAPIDGGCIYTYIPELNQTVRGCPVN